MSSRLIVTVTWRSQVLRFSTLTSSFSGSGGASPSSAAGSSPVCTASGSSSFSVSAMIVPGDERRSAQGAGDGIRTHDNDVGNVVLYQLSYTRPWRVPKL